MVKSVFRAGKNYPPQVFLEEFKNGVQEKKMLEYITYDFEKSSDDYDHKSSDEEN